MQSGRKKLSRSLYPVPPMGLEPTTFALGRQRTTIVLRRLVTYVQANQYGGENRAEDLGSIKGPRCADLACSTLA